ncbi:MAG: hypothetical protein HYX90_07750 [Chloroflexi bacterium]|nr:hypothetical protein [Chloroflexota bacterium]
MPVLIAGVEAISVPSYNLGQIGTTWALSPYFLISGPIVKQLGIEHGIGLNSRGPNPALGRAFGLIIRNLAGFKPGEMAMGTWGYVPPFFLAEDEGFLSQIGWKPYHVELGLEENTSAVTAGATWSWGDQMTMSMVGEGFTRATELLDAMAFDLTRKVVPTLSLRGGPRGFGMATVLLSLPSARFIAAEGYSRQDVVDYLYERTKRTVAEWVEWWVKAGAKPDVPLARLEQYVREGTVSREVLDKPGEKIVPIVAHARQQLKVFVCGDDSKEKTMAMYGWYITPSTRKIELPAAWERLLNEAKERGGMQQAVLAR